MPRMPAQRVHMNTAMPLPGMLAERAELLLTPWRIGGVCKTVRERLFHMPVWSMDQAMALPRNSSECQKSEGHGW